MVEKGRGFYMQEHFKDMSKVQEILLEAQTGLWVMEMDEGRPPRMYADQAMLALLGIEDELSPEACYSHWYCRIEQAYLPLVEDSMVKIISDNRAEVKYPWQHPLWGRIFIRCGGVRDRNYTQGICIRGYHQNITHTVSLEQEHHAVIQSLSTNYSGILLCNLQDKSYKVIKLPEYAQDFTAGIEDYETLVHHFITEWVAEEYQAPIRAFVESAGIQAHLAQSEERQELLYRNSVGDWRRVVLMPSQQYTSEQPWVILAIDEQNGEIEKRLEDAAAQIAMSQTYKLVISVDLMLSGYNCIHYSGGSLELSHRGRFDDFYAQFAAGMPSEDQAEFARIYQVEQYQAGGYLEGTLRRRDNAGVLHYYQYYAALVKQEYEERILLTLRDTDDKWQERVRDKVLSNLCQCYYSIYLFDLEQDHQEAIWQEETVVQSQAFPKGALSIYYEKFVQTYVYAEDQDKMRQIGSPEFLRARLSLEQPAFDVDFRRVYPDHIGWVRARFSLAEILDGKVTKVVFANMDIDEQKRKELAEEEQKRLYVESKNIIQGLSSSYHSVLYVDLPAGTYKAFRLRLDAEHYLKDEEFYSELLESYRDKLIHPQDQERFAQEMALESIRQQFKQGETSYSREYQRDYGGYYGWMRIHIILAESQNGEPVKFIIAAHNVEAEKEQEEQNRNDLLAAYEAAKTANEAKSSFLAQMSHDIRTPINAIVGMAAIASQHIDDRERLQDCLRKIDDSSKHLMALIGDILDMSKIEKGKLELAEVPFSVRELLRELQSIIRQEVEDKAQEITIAADDLVHDQLIGDINRIRQMLLNLLTNAVKYTPSGGHILLGVQEIPARTSDTGCFLFTVEDDGIGMSPEFIERVFQPFARADEVIAQHVPGTGLGMSIAQGIIATMQGDIQVESEPGRGSRITVTLYLQIADVQADAQNLASSSDDPVQTARETLNGVHVLLAEDNPLNMEIAQTMLEEAGLRVDGAANGQAALDKFTASAPGTYDVILMDLQMPILDGYGAAREIRASAHPQAETIPIIALTANAFAEDMAKALLAGMNDHASKPIDFPRLLALMARYVQK